MNSISNARRAEAKSLWSSIRNIPKWKLSLILLSAAFTTIILSAIFVIPTVRMFTQRMGDSTQLVQDPTRRAQFVHVASKLVQENTGLRKELACADSNYDINSNIGGYAIAVSDVCDNRISFFDAYMIRTEVQYSNYEYSQFMMEYDGKYYMLIIPPA